MEFIRYLAKVDLPVFLFPHRRTWNAEVSMRKVTKMKNNKNEKDNILNVDKY